MRISAILVICLVLLSACARRETPRYRIGVSQCSGDYWRVKTNEEMQRELLLHDDVEVDIRSADSDNERQIADIRYFMDNGYDLIIVAPNESAPLTPVVSEAYRRGIPVVTFDRTVGNDDFTAHVEIDNYRLGRSAAEYAKSLLRVPVIAIEIQGPESASPARRRHQGFVDVIGESSADRIVADSIYGNWDDGASEHLTDSLLALYPDVNLIYAHTDHMAIGASRAAARAGRHDIVIIGIDGFPDIGLQAVKDGRMTATLLYPTEGRRLIQTAMAILNHEPFDRVSYISPLPPVDSVNAGLMIRQEEMLSAEAEEIGFLRSRIDDYLSRYSAQRLLLYAFGAIALLLGIVLFLLLRSWYAGQRHRRELEVHNAQLTEERDKQITLYRQLTEATKSKLLFFTNVSHDLRTPLTLIAAPVDQVASADYLRASDRTLLQLARKNIAVLRRLIDQILDFRKYENGLAELNLTEVALGGLLKEWAETFRDAARRRDIRLTVATGADDPTVAVDTGKIERVFFNLMSNALKYTPANGRIRVTYLPEPESVSFSVRDSGSGITEEDSHRIFDMYYQVDRTDSRGSGIGLALSKAFVELHGGTLTVTGEPGKGSEFTVSLPARHCTESQTVRPIADKSAAFAELSDVSAVDGEGDSDNPLLLVIDDSQDIRTLISSLLGDSFRVIESADGASGLKMAVRHVPDLIICDVMMPGMDGNECVRRLKEETTTSHIPVLMLTACATELQRLAGYENGADGYLSKPFGADILIARCRNLIGNRRRIADALHSEGHPQSGDMEDDFYHRFIDEVSTRLGQSQLTVEDMAGVMGLSQSQLARKIKALTNYTPVEIIRNLRLQRARTLLTSTDKTVSEIAYEVGFTSLTYFSRCFREKFGSSPSEFRSL